MTQNTEIEEVEYFVGSGNVFADLGLPNPEELQLKSTLSIEIEAAIKQKRLTKKQAALYLGLSQEELAGLFDHAFSEFSLSQLLHYLHCLGRDVTLSATVRERVPASHKSEQKAVIA